jgi:hypothetical protein
LNVVMSGILFPSYKDSLYLTASVKEGNWRLTDELQTLEIYVATTFPAGCRDVKWRCGELKGRENWTN